MYKIMLVEDEDDIRHSIASIIDWNHCGFELCCQAAGGLEAIEKAGIFQPDVVMTDIFMPYMDGLEMIDRLQELYPIMKYIIVSGHDDFEYVQKALRNNVLDYLLKPLAADGIIQLLHRVKAHLDQDRNRRLNLATLQEKADEAFILMQRIFILELLSERNEYLSEPTYASLYKDLFPAYLAVLTLPNDLANTTILQASFDGREDLLNISILELMQETIHLYGQGQCIRYMGGYLLLMQYGQDQAISCLEALQEKIRYYLGFRTIAAISGQVQEPSELAGAYYNAVLVLERKKREGAGKLFISENQDAFSLSGGTREKSSRKLAALIRAGDTEKLTAFFDELMSHISLAVPPPAELQFWYSLIYIAIFSAAGQAGVSEKSVLDLYQPIGAFGTAPYFEAIEDLRQLAQAVTLRINAGSEDEPIVQKIRAYIDSHYADASLSVEGLCSRFRMSTTQFSLLFRREMGTSFLQYVLDLRIQTARKMLLETDKKIYQIALDCGFTDAGYFSYCFKQRCGITPKEFRKSDDASC